jgi:hypothetical protein
MRSKSAGAATFRWSEAEFSKLIVELLEICAAGGLLSGLKLLLFAFPELGWLDLSLLLEASNEVFSGPANLLSEVSKNAELSVGLQSEDLEGIGNNNSLLLVIGEGDTFEDLQTAESSRALGGLVGEHSSNHSPEDAWWSSEVDMSLSGVGVSCLVEELVELQLVSEERTRLEESLASNNNDSLTVLELLGNFRCKSTNQVASAIYNNLLFEHTKISN